MLCNAATSRALESDKSCQLVGSNPDHCDDFQGAKQTRKNPAIPLGITGFSQIGPAGFEPTTSTTPRLELSDENPIKTKRKRDGRELLPQLLPQESKYVPETNLQVSGKQKADSSIQLEECSLIQLVAMWGAMSGSQQRELIAFAQLIHAAKGEKR